MSHSALIFDVKKFAVHDGPGIRTTYFLKGCPLHCQWCQNPESMDPKQQLCLTRLKCIGCGQCRAVCPGIGEDLLIDRADCNLCGKCISVCKTGARHMMAREMTPEQIAAAAKREKVFYDTSKGGGVTFSGGECMLHADFLAETLRLLKESGIHTVIDTCGAVPRASFEKVLPYADLYLYDVKKLDCAEHRRLTGADNGQILDNLRFLCASGADVIIRVPLIPGLTDGISDMEALAAFISGELAGRIRRVELLPYNKLAESKYENNTAYRDGGCGPYPLGALTPQTNEYVDSLGEVLRRQNIPVFCEKL